MKTKEQKKHHSIKCAQNKPQKIKEADFQNLVEETIWRKSEICESDEFFEFRMTKYRLSITQKRNLLTTFQVNYVSSAKWSKKKENCFKGHSAVRDVDFTKPHQLSSVRIIVAVQLFMSDGPRSNVYHKFNKN